MVYRYSILTCKRRRKVFFLYLIFSERKVFIFLKDLCLECFWGSILNLLGVKDLVGYGSLGSWDKSIDMSFRLVWIIRVSFFFKGNMI